MPDADRTDAPPAPTFNADAQRAIAARVAAAFGKPWHRDYVRGKLRLDPVYAAVAARLQRDAQALLDVGCGIGLLGLYLRERGHAGAYLGVDFDANKIALARRAAAHCTPPLIFQAGDAGALPASAGHVAVLDVLHYLSASAQQALLADCMARVAPGALLIVRSVLRNRSWRFRATVIEEFFLHATRWMKSPARHYPLREEIEAPLHSAGFTVETVPLWGRTPFNSFFLVARRAR